MTILWERDKGRLMTITALKQEVEIGIQAVIRGDSLDIQEVIDLAVQFFKMGIPVLILIIAMRNTYLDYRYQLRVTKCKRAAYREAHYQSVSPQKLWIFAKVAPVLVVILVGALLYGCGVVK